MQVLERLVARSPNRVNVIRHEGNGLALANRSRAGLKRGGAVFGFIEEIQLLAADAGDTSPSRVIVRRHFSRNVCGMKVEGETAVFILGQSIQADFFAGRDAELPFREEVIVAGELKENRFDPL